MAKYTEEEYREAARIWRDKNPTKEKIPRNEVIEISNGKIVSLGTRINNMRSNLEKLDDNQKEFWKDYGIFDEKKSYTEEEYREAATIWKSKNPEVKRIPSRLVVEISNGKIVPLGARITTMRSYLESLSDSQKEFWKDYGLFGEKKSYTEEEYREAAIIWKSKNPQKEKILRNEVIEISNGRIIPIGNKMKVMRANPESLDKEKQEFWKDYGLFYKKESKIDIVASKINSLEKYIEMFAGDKEKATRVEKCLKDLREKRRVKKKQEWNIDNILKEFDVDLETLEKYLARTRTKEIEPRAEVIKYQGQTLRSFCIENGYNYDVVVRAIKLHDMCRYDTLEQLINRSLTTYNKKGQREPATWIYEKYGNLVKHVLLHLKLDSTSILRDMTNYIMTLEEAVRHDVFKRNIDNKGNAWLEELYNYLIEEINDNKEQKQTEEDIADMFVILVQEYKLTKEEYQVLWKTFSNYVDTMREYQRVDVGLETNQSRKLEKIRQYNLDEYDIEESFFIPLEFDRGVLLGSQSELYKRRQLLKQYIIYRLEN